jgi:preprotein translocase subunit YajC
MSFDFLAPFVTDAHAQGAGAPNEQSMMPLVFIVVMFVVFYFLLIRPQAKRQKEIKTMIESLNKGDEVVTTGGLVGRIAEMSDQFLTLQVGTAGPQPVTVSVQRSSVATLLPKGTIKSI